MNLGAVTDQYTRDAPRSGIDHRDRGVRWERARNQCKQGSVRRERAVSDERYTLDRLDLAAGRAVPDLEHAMLVADVYRLPVHDPWDHLWGTSGDHSPTFRGKCAELSSLAMCRGRQQLGRGGESPDLEQLVRGGRCNELTIGRD